MAEPIWIDAAAIKASLASFFDQRRKEVGRFGSTVNQTFEAFVFGQTIEWYRASNYEVAIVNPPARRKRLENPGTGPPTESLRLKFSTRGRPDNYSFARCTSPEGDVFQIRHQIRVATRHYRPGTFPRANICLDVAVIRDCCLSHLSSSDHVDNNELLTFGEAKHMSAFAELVASFVGVVHEMQPERLKRTVGRALKERSHPSPFLFVNGTLWATAEGVELTIKRRKYDIAIYSRVRLLAASLPLPLRKP